MTVLAQRLREIDPDTFQNLCYHILRERHPGLQIRQVEGSGGDRGIDVFVGELEGRVSVWQCKYFKQIGKSQKTKIEKSLERVLESFALHVWVLCIPTDLDIRAHKWFQALQHKYADRASVGLFQGSDIEHELIYRHKIRDYFFPGAAWDPAEIKALLITSGEFTTEELKKITGENVQQYVRRLEEKDARFTYRVVFPQESEFPSFPDLIDGETPSGLVLSVSDQHTRVDLFARDEEALRRDPPKVTLRLKASAAEKLIRNMKTGSVEEIVADEIISMRSSFDFLFPQPTAPAKLVVGPPVELKKRRHSFRVTFSQGTDSVVYQLLELAATRAGTEETEISTVDKELPFKMDLVIRDKGEITWNYKQEWAGKEVHAVQKANKAIALMLRGGDVEFFHLKLERVLGRGGGVVGHHSVSGVAAFSRLLDDLVEISDRFGVALRIPHDPRDEDLENLQLLLEIGREGRVTMKHSGVSLQYAKSSDVDARTFLEGEKEMRGTLPKLNPPPKIMGSEIDTGPVTVHMRRAIVKNLEQTVQAFIAAAEGEAARITLEPLVPMELVFSKFVRPPS